MDGRIFDLRIHLLQHLDQDWTVQEMAKKTGLSASRFPAVFKAATGIPPSAFLKEARLEKAKQLIETTHDQIKQICIQVGMPNESHFTRDFKYKYEMSPTEYRRRFQEKRQAEMLRRQIEI